MDDILEKDLVYDIIGCAMTIHNDIGHGLREKTYERALCVELTHNKIPHTQQQAFSVTYRDIVIDSYVPDLLVNDTVIVETKTVEQITDEHRGQLLNYLRITGLKVGIIINFKHSKLQWERLVLDTARNTNSQSKY